MENANFNQLVSFVFGIANDCLVDVYDVGDYRKIILPMIVLRRFDAVLEPTKQAVLAMKQKLDAAGILEQDVALCSVAHEAFCNSSPFTLSDLKSRTNQQQLKQDFILYLDGFSKNVQDIITKFDGLSISSASELKSTIAYYKEGETVDVTYMRANNGEYEEHTVSVTLAKSEAAAKQNAQQKNSTDSQSGNPKDGLTVPDPESPFVSSLLPFSGRV